MQPEDLVGKALGHYRIKRQIGYGGMATVFLGEDIHLNREVALKVFWPRPGETIRAGDTENNANTKRQKPLGQSRLESEDA